jgi:hypothetical protein
MTPKFLRQEAARFRDMADTADREASKLRLLSMAADYDARAKAAAELTKPSMGEAVKSSIDGKIAKEADEAVSSDHLTAQ